MPRPEDHGGASRQRPPGGTARPPAAPRPRPAHLVAICAVLVLVTLAAFRGVLANGFVNYDDNRYVTENAHVLEGLNGDSVAWAFTTADQANWHPVTWLSHMLDVRLFGLDAGKHHLTSLLLHAANAVLLFLLLVRMTGALWRSAFVACLFALHPLHVESVAWIAERKDVLSTLFWLLTLLAWLSYLGSRTAVRYVLVVALYALGLMAKPMLVTLPFTLLLLDTWPLRRLTLSLRESSAALPGLLLEKAPLFAMSAASCVVTFAAQRSGGAVLALEKLPFAQRLANTSLAYVSYLGKTFWPTSLAVFYPYPRAALPAWSVAGSALLLAGCTLLVLRLARRAPYLAFGWLWYLGTLVPVIGLVQVGAQAMADRYTYVPLIGIFVAIAWGLAELAERPRPARFAVAAVSAVSILALSVVTRAQVGHWADDKALFEHALAVTSDNWMAHSNLAGALAGAGRIDAAIDHLEQALRIDPGNAEAHYNMGNTLFKAGRLDEAIEHYDQALRLRPDDAEAHGGLGDALARKGRNAEAIEQFEQAVRLKPDYVEALNGLGVALARTDRLPEAIERYRQALRIRPDFAEAHNNLGVALARASRLPEALGHFEEALRIQPDLGDARVNLERAREALRQPR